MIERIAAPVLLNALLVKVYRTSGMLCLVWAALSLSSLAGCSKPAPVKVGEIEHAHEHEAEGPHHGDLIELGEEEFHAELVHDEAAHKVTIYLLDGEVKKNAPTAAPNVVLNVISAGQPAQYTLLAAPQDGDPAGQSSRFELVDEALCESLDAPKATARLNVTIGEKAFVGELAEHEHHDHADEKK